MISRNNKYKQRQMNAFFHLASQLTNKMEKNKFFGKCTKVITRTSPSGYKTDTYIIQDINAAMDWRNNYIGAVLEAGGNNIERLNIKEGSVGTFFYTSTIRTWQDRWFQTNTIDSFELYNPNAATDEPKDNKQSTAKTETKKAVEKAENAIPTDGLPF